MSIRQIDKITENRELTPKGVYSIYPGVDFILGSQMKEKSENEDPFWRLVERLSKKYGGDKKEVAEEIRRANDLSNDKRLFVGDKLTVPFGVIPSPTRIGVRKSYTSLFRCGSFLPPFYVTRKKWRLILIPKGAEFYSLPEYRERVKRADREYVEHCHCCVHFLDQNRNLIQVFSFSRRDFLGVHPLLEEDGCISVP